MSYFRTLEPKRYKTKAAQERQRLLAIGKAVDGALRTFQMPVLVRQSGTSVRVEAPHVCRFNHPEFPL